MNPALAYTRVREGLPLSAKPPFTPFPHTGAHTVTDTAKHQIAALLINASIHREMGDESRAQQLERAAALLENPGLPPALEERVQVLELALLEQRVIFDTVIIGLARALGVGKGGDLAHAANEIDSAAPGEATPLMAAAIKSGRADALELLRRTADMLVTQSLADALTTQSSLH